MKHEIDWYQQFFEYMNTAELLLVFLIFGFCFAVMIRPYVRKKQTVYAAGILTAAGGTILWQISENGGTLNYLLVMLAAFLPIMSSVISLILWDFHKQLPLKKSRCYGYLYASGTRIEVFEYTK